MSANGRAILFLAFGVVSAFLAVLLFRSWMQGENLPQVSAAPVVETVPVVISAGDVSAGTSLSADQLTVTQWPKLYLPSGSYSSPDELVGRVLRRNLKARDPVFDYALVAEGSDAGLTALIKPDHRAISVKVDPVVGVAGFIQPGSSVDVLATLRRAQNDQLYTQVILQDIRVLAIDQKLEENDDGEPQPEATVVTLEVTPRDAQKLSYAGFQGELQLALRNSVDQNVMELSSVTGKDLLPLPAPVQPRVPAGSKIEQIRGSDISDKTL